MAPTRIDYSEPSSPDPLADSLMEEYASQPSPWKSIVPKKNKAGQRRRKSSDITIKSSEIIAEQGTSPWRIKVTVEAEQEEDIDMDTGTGRRQTITRTMKIPLRDADSPTKKSRKTNRATTTESVADIAPSARETRSRRKSVTDLNTVVLGDDAEDDEWTAAPRSPRKGKSSKGKDTRKSAAASRRSMSDTIDIREDEDTTDDRDSAHSRNDFTPEIREIDLNQIALKTGSDSVRQNNGRNHGQEKDVRKVSINSAMSYPTPSPTASEYGRSDDVVENLANNDEVGLDTVMESEGFTMIDLESLPSVKQMRNTPEYPTITEEQEDEDTGLDSIAGNSQVAVEAPSIHLSTLPEESSDTSTDFVSSPPIAGKKKLYSIGHLQLPSSTNVYRHRHVTPMPQSSPSLPSPPRAPASVAKERSPANSNKAMVAGLVLQDAVTPEHSLLSDHQQDSVPRDQEEEALFGGFSSSTRRELRADLRFGEELGKKQLSKLDESPGIPDKRLHGAAFLTRPQVWRGETTVQRTPPVGAMDKQIFTEPADRRLDASTNTCNSSAPAKDETRWKARARKDREEVIENANSANKDDVLVIDSDSGNETESLSDEDGEVDETMGDIWLAEARNHSSSPRDTIQQQAVESPKEKPKRKLIPSPWKRGERIDINSTSQLSSNESFTGILFKENGKAVSSGFGAAILANPDRVPQQDSFDRRRSGEVLDSGAIIKQPRRLSPRRDEDDDDQDIDDENFNGARDCQEWRDASDVVEEETELLEAEHKLAVEEDNPIDGPVGATTRLYETNLEDLSEQDLSSSPHIQLSKKRDATVTEHDSTYSSLSEESVEEVYRQRTSLSPSKHRPITPRSALKGGRNSFGAALIFGPADPEATDKKVVWAKRMSCMNEEWEESSRSIKSTQESFQDDTPTPLTVEKPLSQAREHRQHEQTFLVDPQPPSQGQSGKGWFSWFKQVDDTQKQPTEVEPSEQTANPKLSEVPNLDGSLDSFIEDDRDPNRDDSSYAPTSRHTSIPRDPFQTRKTHPSPPSKSELPSYLLAPSYPSDPTRDPSIPLSTSGLFTNTHFKTLHIIYRKSLRPRFHGPSYPSEVRPALRDLVEEKWTLKVDESEMMDEVFEFTVGVQEARVLERFMREVEHGYARTDGGRGVQWGWSVEGLAGRLGRVAIGEVVREEEKEARKILGSKNKGGEKF